MTQQTAIKLFDEKKVRIVWDDVEEKYFFSIVDVVNILTEQSNPRGASTYWAVLKKRLKQEGAEELLTNCKQLKLPAADGKNYKTDVADLEQILRIIQSIPSKKAEPVRQGYSDRWINERMRSIEMRKELTDEWHRSGIHESKDFAILTNILTKAWSGMSTREYKNYKGLTKENLRDNMTNLELALNTLAEVTTTELSRQRNPRGMAQTSKTAQEGGEVARNARADIESRLGRSVVSPERASDYLKPIETQDADTMMLPDSDGAEKEPS